VRHRHHAGILALGVTASHSAGSGAPSATLRLDHRAIARDVIRIGIRVHEEPDRPRCHPGNGGQKPVAVTGRARIHHEHTLAADLQRHVAAGSGHHGDLALHRQHLEPSTVMGGVGGSSGTRPTGCWAIAATPIGTSTEAMATHASVGRVARRGPIAPAPFLIARGAERRPPEGVA